MKPCWAWAGWEPDRHYQRIGRRETAYFGHGAWLPQWRRRLEQPQTLRVLGEAGITTLVTWCYKGFGLDLESRQWPELRRFIETAHGVGLEVIGYVQGGSLYTETLLAEQPAARAWVAQRQNGEPCCWGGQYYRAFPCLGNEQYLAYMEQVIEQALGLGLDGIHMDNSYHPHCWCPPCQSDFRTWLGTLPDLEQRTGLPWADHVAAPMLPAEQDSYSDPIQILWMEFGVQRRLVALRRFRDCVKRISPSALYTGNPAFPRGPGFKAKLSLDPSREGEVFDALFAENGNLPARIEGQYVSQAQAYAFGQAGGYRVLSTAWRKGPQGHSPAATAAQVWTGLAEEFSHDAAWLGNNWALRPVGDGSRMLMDDNPLHEAFVQAMRFFRSVEQAAELDRRASWSELAVLVAPDTLTLAARSDGPAFAALLQELLGRHVPFQFLWPEGPIPPEVRALLVWQQSCLSDAALKRVREFAESADHVVLVAGNSGYLDEAAVPRNASDWRAWLDHPRMHHQPLRGEEAATIVSSQQHLGRDRVQSTCATGQAMESLLSRWLARLRIHAPANVLVHTERVEQRLLIHWRDQEATGERVEGCRLELDRSLMSSGEIRMFHPDRVQGDALVADDGNIGVPAFRHYALVEIPLAKKG